MVQWALTTVMGLGLALIGINWFTTTRDKVDIRELEVKLQNTISRYEAQTESVNERIAALDRALWPHDRQRLWDEFVEMQMNQHPPVLSTPALMARVFLESDHDPNTVDAHDAIVELLPTLQEYDPDLAIRAYQFVSRDLELSN